MDFSRLLGSEEEFGGGERRFEGVIVLEELNDPLDTEEMVPDELSDDDSPFLRSESFPDPDRPSEPNLSGPPPPVEPPPLSESFTSPVERVLNNPPDRFPFPLLL